MARKRDEGAQGRGQDDAAAKKSRTSRPRAGSAETSSAPEPAGVSPDAPRAKARRRTAARAPAGEPFNVLNDGAAPAEPPLVAGEAAPLVDPLQESAASLDPSILPDNLKPQKGRRSPAHAARTASPKAAAPATGKVARPRRTGAEPAVTATASAADDGGATQAAEAAGGAPVSPAPVRDSGQTGRSPDRPKEEHRAAPTAPPVAEASQQSGSDAPVNPLAVPGLPARLAENIERIEALGQRLLRAMAARPLHNPGVEGPGPELYGSVAQAWLKMATEQPARIIEQQVRFWGQTLRHVAEAQSAFAAGTLTAPAAETPADRRFQNPLWQTHPFYNFVMRQYHINAEAIRKAAADLDIDGEVDRRRIDWFTRQMIDMLAPTNFLATNPDALEKAIETEGASLVRGLENLVRDVEANGGELVVSLADRNAFRVGENIGTTPGEVVYRTPMLELIQFHPSTETVHETPIVVFPPWINKYYIMDLKPQNSLLRWIVDQGYTLFVVSWKNPDASHASQSMDDYVSAYLDVMSKVQELTGQRQLNAVGYCIAGTTLAATLALMKQRGDDRVRSATFFTTLTDFSDQGEFTTFLQDDFVGGIEDEVARTGYLSAQLMQRTFSFLRANDLVWAPAIRSYMLGEPPPAFDLLYWNGDGTNLPGRMVTQYLRDLCQNNALARGGFDILGHRLHLSEVTVPVCAVACEGDHIAPWIHSWKGIAQMGSADRTFILSESGHIAGIINPPGRVKYGHYSSAAGFSGSASDWRAAAEFHPGSWWGRWGDWLEGRSGPMVPAREPRDSLAPAPGTYVHEKA